MKKLIQNIILRFFRFSKGKKGLYGMNYNILINVIDTLEYGNGGTPETSGEINVMRQVKTHFKNAVVFDCGSNKGQYAGICLKEIGPDITIHCFEPAKNTFTQLQNNLGNKSNIKLNKAGVGEKTTKMKLYSDSDTSIHAALFQHDLSHHNLNMKEQEEVDIITLDNYCRENSVSKINLLKLDIEGYEYFALLGAKEILSNNTVDLVQFEMGKTNIESRTYFKDFFNLLNKDYKFYRVMTWGLKEMPEEYMELNELFYCCNYVAVNRNLKDFISSLN
ncbi:MAG: FkbM family methyltransferase [Bacteroidia bacterium]